MRIDTDSAAALNFILLRRLAISTGALCRRTPVRDRVFFYCFDCGHLIQTEDLPCPKCGFVPPKEPR